MQKRFFSDEALQPGSGWRRWYTLYSIVNTVCTVERIDLSPYSKGTGFLSLLISFTEEERIFLYIHPCRFQRKYPAYIKNCWNTVLLFNRMASCFHRICRFFGGLQTVAGNWSALGFSTRLFRRGQRRWYLWEFRKGLVGKRSEYGQPFRLRGLSIQPQGMGVSIKTTWLGDLYCVSAHLFWTYSILFR